MMKHCSESLHGVTCRAGGVRMRKVHLSFTVDHYNHVRARSLGQGHEQQASIRHGNRPWLPLRKELGLRGDGGDAAMAAAAGGRTQVTVVGGGG